MNAGHQEKRVKLLICIGIVAATFAAYEPTLHNSFVGYDDKAYITENSNVTGGITQHSVIWAFTKYSCGNWHPLTWLSHMLDCQLFGLNPAGHHLVSLLFPIVNSLLLFWIFTKMTGATWPSAFVAAVFALHPLHVESVAWAAERKDVLCGLFWMLTMLAYVHYARRPNFKRYSLVLIAFMMGLMSKPMIVTLPFVLLLLDWWPLERLAGFGNDATTTGKKQQIVPAGCPKATLRHLVAEKVPLFVLSAISGVITLIAQHSGGAVVTLEKLPLNYRIGNTLISYIRYIGKMIWPSRLVVAYSYPHNLSMAAVIFCTLLFIFLSVLSIYICRRKKYVAVGWLWYVGTLLPVIGLVQVGSQAIADRYMYLPMLGLLIIAAWAVKDLVNNRPHRRFIASVLVTAILLSFAILSRIQVKYWQNSITLFEHALKVTENNSTAENGYGCALLDEGRLNDAEQHLNNAVRLNPASSLARNNLGNVMLRQGKLNEAIACFNELLKQNEKSVEVHYNLGVALSMQKKYEEAIKHFAKVMEINPVYSDARNRMGIALMAAGRPDEAIEYFTKLLQQNNNSAEVHYNLAVALGMQKKYDDAIKHFTKVLEIDPNYSDVHSKIGITLMIAGRYDEAAAYFNEILRTSKDPAEVYTNLGVVYTKAGKYELAIQSFTKASELKPNSSTALNNLAWVLAATGDISVQDANKAINLAEHACELTGHKDPSSLDTLAVAYAAAGKFQDAIMTAEKALNIAKAAGQENAVRDIQNRLELYKAGKPYRER